MIIPKGNNQRGKIGDFHLIPGRLGIGVPGLLNNQEQAKAIVHRLANFPGVRICNPNTITGRLLVYFDHGKTDLELLISLALNHQDQGDKLERGSSPSGRAPKKKTPGDKEPKNRVSIDGVATPWHVLESAKALEMMQSSIEVGLSNYIARERLRLYGPNELRKGAGISFRQIILDSFNGFMVKLLLAAAGISLLLGERIDAAVIGAIVMIQAVVEAAQSYRAEKSLDKLKELTDPLATVLREGETLRVPSRELVPGDIIHLSAGDVVPADARIINASNLLTNESCLTGESIPVAKDVQKARDAQIPIADQANMLFSGTNIVGGQVSALVVTTGMETELGRIASLLRDVKNERTNLQKQLDVLGGRITHLVIASVGIIAFISLLRGSSMWQVLRAGISLAVGAVPEGLPAVLTVALSTGVQRMVRRKAIVRNLSAVETLGATTVICADKTGTLTKNEMTVKELYIDGNYYNITGDGYHPQGEILRPGTNIQEDNHPLVQQILKTGALCNNAELRLDTKGQWSIFGDPTEGALLTAAAKGGMWWEDLKNDFCRHKEVAFDAQRRTMTVVCGEEDGGYGVYVKGAPDAVINYCSFFARGMDDHEQPLDEKLRQKILQANDRMAGKAFRVMAFAYKILPPGTDIYQLNLDEDLVFCGLMGMSDSPRPGVKEAIQKCQTAGIKVVMITGDHQKTAEAIANKLGILGQSRSMTGKELGQLSDEELAQRVETVAVYSRTTPEQKLRIVRALKSQGQIVAMTGDGVNDAPAVKEANIGIAMGLSGTDVTREVAGITLSDDNFVTIVNGIEEGRTVSMNLSKSIRYILSGSFGQIFTAFTAASLGLPPLSCRLRFFG